MKQAKASEQKNELLVSKDKEAQRSLFFHFFFTKI